MLSTLDLQSFVTLWGESALGTGEWLKVFWEKNDREKGVFKKMDFVGKMWRGLRPWEKGGNKIREDIAVPYRLWVCNHHFTKKSINRFKERILSYALKYSTPSQCKQHKTHQRQFCKETQMRTQNFYHENCAEVVFHLSWGSALLGVPGAYVACI